MNRSAGEGRAQHSEAHRLFFALWPDAPTRARIAAAADLLKRHPRRRGHWLKPDKYHVTLHFLGVFPSAPHALARRACDAANEVTGSAFALTLDRAGSFRNRSIPWWLGCSAIPVEMTDLWNQLAASMRRRDVPYEAKSALTPHVTVLRDSDETLPSMPLPPLPWQVEEFVLIHSRTLAQSQYRLLGRWSLPQRSRAAAPKNE